MCLAKVYMGEQKELIMEDVALVEINGGNLQLSTLFGERKEVAASIKAVDFQSGRIILEAAG